MAAIVGCLEAHELTLCKRGANQHAHVLLLKSMPADKRGKIEPPSPPNPPEPEMDKAQIDKAIADGQDAAVAAAIAKMAAMTDTTKSYIATLSGDALVAFTKKTAAEQNAESEAAKAAADKAKTDEEASKALALTDAGKAVAESETVKTLRAELDALKAKDADAEIAKRARTDFAGFPGGEVAAVKMLKSTAGMDDEGRTAVEDLMKAQIAYAKKAVGGLPPADPTVESSGSMGQLRAKAMEIVKSDKVSFDKAFNMVTQDPANAELFAKAMREEDAAVAA